MQSSSPSKHPSARRRPLVLSRSRILDELPVDVRDRYEASATLETLIAIRHWLRLANSDETASQ